MSSKKEISLLGRKRTKELELDQAQPGQLDKTQLDKIQPDKTDKKEQLISLMNSEIIPETIPEPSVGPAVIYEKEVKAAVNMLIKMHTQMREAGTSNRREYSFYEQNRKLINEIRGLLAEKADFYESKGLNDEDNRRACQQYINDIRAGLGAVGILVNYLEVRPVKNPA